MVDLKLPKKRVFYNPAPAWKRIISFIVDFMIIQLVIFGPFSGALTSILPTGPDFFGNYEALMESQNIVRELYVLMGIMFALVFIYFILFEYRMRQTPGKMLFNLYLVPEDKKQQLSLLQVFLRNLAVFPFFPFSLLWIIDPLYMVISGKRLSDIFSKTQITEETSV
jgi:uncharacterized RDD family membrane protein YckC